MTPTTRWTVAQRRKRQVITRTVRERALHDPRRRHTTDRRQQPTTPAAHT